MPKTDTYHCLNRKCGKSIELSLVGIPQGIDATMCVYQKGGSLVGCINETSNHLSSLRSAISFVNKEPLLKDTTLFALANATGIDASTGELVARYASTSVLYEPECTS